MKILGIDPGYGTLGWAVIDSAFKIIDYGAVFTDPKSPIDERLFRIHKEINNIIAKYNPDCLAVEKLFFAKNSKTAIDVAKSIGVVLLSARMNNLPYDEYSPLQVKSALTGYGRASKDQIQNIILKIFKLKEFPCPDDAADALAIAACHCLSSGNLKYK